MGWRSWWILFGGGDFFFGLRWKDDGFFCDGWFFGGGFDYGFCWGGFYGGGGGFGVGECGGGVGICDVDVVIVEYNEVVMEEGVDGLFEGFFVYVKDFVDFFGGGFVVVGEWIVFGDEFGEDFFGEWEDVVVVGVVEVEVDFVVGMDGVDVVGEFLVDGEWGGEVGVVEEVVVGVFYDVFKVEFGFVVDEEVDGLVFLVVWWGEIEVLVEMGGGDDVVGFFVEENVGDDLFVDVYMVGLFVYWEEEVFGEILVEEGVDVGVDVDDVEWGEFVDLDMWSFCSGDDVVFGVEVDEDDEGFVGECVLWYVVVGYEDFVEVVVVEEDVGCGDVSNCE